MKAKLTFVLIILLMFVATSVYAATFKGKVIDADTKEPVEGAVVVASWLEETTAATATHSRLKDVKEVLTDKNGEWMIKGPRGRSGGSITSIFTFLSGTYYTRPPEFIIFKPGYCSWPAGLGIEACKEKMKPFSVGGGEILELPKLTSRQDRLRSSAIWPSLMESDKESLKKIRNFLILLDKENRSLGLSPDPRVKEIEK